MKVLIYGHSYVRDLVKLQWKPELTVNGEQQTIHYSFRYFPGKDYEFLLNKDQEFEVLAEIKPDYVILVLGGNSIVNFKSNNEIKTTISEFYLRLHASLPHTIKLAVQIEPRYYLTGNHFHAPTAEEFNRRRQVLNNYLNKAIKKKGHLDHMVLLGSAADLNPTLYLADGVHMNEEGLLKYQAAIIRSLTYAMEQRQ